MLQTTSVSPDELRELQSYLKPHELDELEAIIEDWPDLADFIESTSTLRLDPWQCHLCARLQRLRYEKGQRILVHAPPQVGKSVIVSQRFPAWLLGCRPTNRIRLACYNMTHSARFGEVVRNLMQDRIYKALFPVRGSHIRDRQSQAEFSTLARESTGDAQPSFMALGLATGFVGQGADTLIIDDPYASPQDAASPAIRASVWMFWDESARVRINAETNVVVMFHRYREDDLAGKLLEEGGWELLRYAMVADGDYKAPDGRLFPDPLGREIGEKLSPRIDWPFIENQKLSGYAWMGQFQGRPTPREGAMFKVMKINYMDPSEVPNGIKWVRAWDYASSEGSGDFTSGAKVGIDDKKRVIVADVVRGQWGSDTRNSHMLATAERDGPSVVQRLPQDPGAAGKSMALEFTRLLQKFPVRIKPVTGDKSTRADPFSSQVNCGNAWFVRGPWNSPVIETLRQFPTGKNDDDVDALSDAYSEIVNGPAYVDEILF